MNEDDRLLDALRSALDEGPAEPPPERVAALRRHVAASGSTTPPGPVRPGRVPRWLPPFALGAAAAAAVAVGLAVVRDDGAEPVPAEVVDVAVEASGVDADALLVAHTWGTEVDLVIRGLADGQRYVVTVQDEAGRDVPAGTFVGVSDRPVECSLNAAVLRDDARSFRVATAAGAVVLSADIA